MNKDVPTSRIGKCQHGNPLYLCILCEEERNSKFDGRVEHCIHGVSEREECEHCGFSWVPERG